MCASIGTYGDTIHSFVQRGDYAGVHLPGYTEVAHDPLADRRSALGLVRSTTWSATSSHGEMDNWAGFYQRILGFSQLRHFDDEDISTEYSALMSKVLWDGHGRIKMPINEPAEGRKKSQIEEYLDAYGGPGVQHLALATDDIVATVAALQRRGVDLPDGPGRVLRRGPANAVGDVDEAVGRPQRDSGSWSTATTRATCCRSSPNRSRTARRCSTRSSSATAARGFGAGNFKALFEAIERAQDRRGNL